jgi:paraquat-inducible protein B
VNDLDTSRLAPPDIDEPKIERRRFSFVWVLPIIAVLVAAWLGYTAYAERGPLITIQFKTAAGLEAGKTRIKHHDVELGLVQRIELSPDLAHVTVYAQMQNNAEPHLKQATKFWVVRPRFSGLNLSGLETLVSGAYIELDPGSGGPRKDFVGLEDPPVVRSEVPGTEYLLTTERIGALGPGSPIFFRGLTVGEVIAYEYKGADRSLEVRAFVRKPYDDMVTETTRFWNASGITIGTTSTGFKLELESLQAVIAGGIAFDTLDAPDQAKAPAPEGAAFRLFDDRQAAEDAGFSKRARALIEFEGSVRGLEVGAPVEVNGIRIGRVVDIKLVIDAAARSAKVPVVVELDFGRLGIVNQEPKEFGSGHLAHQLVAFGMRAQLRPASLITGQLIVAFDFFPEAPSADIIDSKPYPTLPSVPSTRDALTKSLTGILEKLAALPLEEIAADLRGALNDARTALGDARGMLGDAREVVGNPEIQAAIRSLNKTLGAAESLVVDVNAQSKPLLTSLVRASDALDATLKRADTMLVSLNTGYGKDSQVRGEIAELLRQLQEAARSVRIFANYIEQHPEALLRGKGGGR